MRATLYVQGENEGLEEGPVRLIWLISTDRRK